MKIINIIKKFIENFERHHIFIMAAGISFNILLYSLPLMLVMLYLLTVVFDKDNIMNTIQTLLNEFLPNDASSIEFTINVLDEAQRLLDSSTIFGVVGVFILLWLSSALISTVRYALNNIFDLKSEKIFILYRLKDIILVIILTILIFIYSYIMPFVSFFSNKLVGIVSFLPSELISNLLTTLVSLITGFILLYFIYRHVPVARIARKSRLLATSLALVLLELARYIFSWYVSSIASYGKIYGVYAVLVSLALWIYYTALIILFSAEVANLLNEDYKTDNNIT